MDEDIRIDRTRLVAFRMDTDLWGDRIQINICGIAGAPNLPDSKRYVASIQWKEADPHVRYGRLDSMLDLSSQDAVDLMDMLWRLGIRPKDIGTPGHLAATQAHLADFRAIVAKQLGIEMK